MRTRVRAVGLVVVGTAWALHLSITALVGWPEAAAVWLPAGGCAGTDVDGDGYCAEEDDCDDSNAEVHPGAPQRCDGVNYDCFDPNWPDPAVGEVDDDGDGWTDCAGDCNDGDPGVHPSAQEECNGIDDDCAGGLDDAPDCARTCGAPGERVDEVKLSDADMRWWPALTWNGDGFGVAWVDAGPVFVKEPTYRLRLQTLTEGGEITGSHVIVGPFESDGIDFPFVVWNGMEYGVSWTRRRGGSPNGNIEFARVAANGDIIAGPTTLTDDLNSRYVTTLVWTGSNYVLVWLDLDEDVAHLGVVKRDASGFERTVRLLDTEYLSRGIWDGVALGFGWFERMGESVRPVFGRFDLQGREVSDRLVIAEEGGPPLIAWDGLEYGLVWNSLDGSGDYRYATVGLDGALTRLPRTVFTQQLPLAFFDTIDLVHTGEAIGMILAEEISSETIMRFVQFDVEGALLDDRYVTPVEDRFLRSISLAWTGRGFAVAYGAVDEDDPGPVRLRHAYLAQIRCECADEDADGYFPEGSCGNLLDCDDLDEVTYPAATQLCDGRNNDCDDETWPAIPGDELDDDGDGFRACSGECDDGRPDVYPGAAQLCDGVNNDCADPLWPTPPAEDADADGDGIATCAGDCDDTDEAVYANAPQLCDGVNNDCLDPAWPVAPPDEVDADHDDWPLCADCDDDRWRIHPGAGEACNGRDDDCDGLIDDDALGEDTDADMLHNACDNCVVTANPDQADVDGDRAGDACDNCVSQYNPGQADSDEDSQGDHCDLDDALIYVAAPEPNALSWQPEAGFVSWNVYRGDLAVLVASGDYTQDPGTNPLAARTCGLTQPEWSDPHVPDSGQIAFYLVTGISAQGGESGLGMDNTGAERPNAHPCP